MEAPRASGSGLPRDLIQVRGRGFAGYTKTTDRTGRVIPVAVMVVMPRVATQACTRPGGGTRLALAFIFDMGPRDTTAGGAVKRCGASSAAFLRCERNS